VGAASALAPQTITSAASNVVLLVLMVPPDPRFAGTGQPGGARRSTV